MTSTDVVDDVVSGFSRTVTLPGTVRKLRFRKQRIATPQA